MEKPILFYEVRPQANRSTGGTILVPAIVERGQDQTQDRENCPYNAADSPQVWYNIRPLDKLDYN